MAEISVIIPVFNVEEYVGSCLESVQRQSFQDLEILCVNDASEDASFEIVRRIAGTDSRIRCIENERNQGLASARNRGLEHAEGKYVYFLDSDDMIRQDALEKLYERASAEKLDALIFASEFIFETEALKETFSRDRSGFRRIPPEILNGRDLFVLWMENWDWMPSQPRYFYNRRFLERNSLRFPDGRLHEDEFFTFDVLMHASRIRIIDEKLFIRRFRGNSIMSSVPTMKNVESCLEILKRTGEFSTEEESLRKAVRFYMYKIMMETVRKYRALSAFGRPAALTEEAGRDPVIRSLFTMIEAYSLWGGTGS